MFDSPPTGEHNHSPGSGFPVVLPPDAHSRVDAPVLPSRVHSHIPEQVLEDQALRERLEDEITTLAGHLNAANHRLIKLLDEFDRRDGWRGVGVRSLAHWLNFKCGIGKLAAREKVRVARALRDLPKIDAAFERGEISYSKVRAMTRAATPENEAFLVQIARHGTADHMERLVRAYRRHGDVLEASKTESGRRREGRFWCHEEDDGTMVFGGRLPLEQGLLLKKALDAMVAESESESESESGSESESEAKAEAEAERDVASGIEVGVEVGAEERSVSAVTPATVCDADGAPAESPASAGDADSVPAETPAPASDSDSVSAEAPAFASDADGVSAETPDRAVSRAAALARIAEHYLATGGERARSLAGHEACQVFVHVNANDAHPDSRIDGGHVTYTDDRRWVAPEVARQLACDAALTTVLENDRGEVLNIGRRSRTVPRRIAHALRIRDGGCRFPSCGQRRWTDAHHIRHWADGGETSLDNLVTLCRYHHRSLHGGEFRIERGAGGELKFIGHDGQAIAPTLHPQFPGVGNAAAATQRLKDDNRERGVAIDRRTAVTRWTGERMDYSLCVGALMHRDGYVN